MRFLPISREDMDNRDWHYLDFVLISGDAYVDHPSFGVAIISRVLESAGYRVGIIPQPDWKDPQEFKRLGRPRLAFLITSGNIDSMVNHFTAAKKRRSEDLYSPGGKAGRRPDRATIVYSHRAREAYKDVPIILGGIEASLRRLAHYDYWEDKVRRSILLDAKADLLVYGMAEASILEIARALGQGTPVDQITGVRGTVYRSFATDHSDALHLPTYQEISEEKRAFAQSFAIQDQNTDAIRGKTLIESYGDYAIVQNPPAPPLPCERLDQIYALPYTREAHPSYAPEGGVPALDEVKFSLTSNRGCYGGCRFCALTFHQGRVVQARSHRSLLDEAQALVEEPEFKGYIHDVGGPTANFRSPACTQQSSHGTCKDRDCLFPRPCNQLRIDHKDYLSLLRKLRRLKGVKKVFVRSGLRYDYLIHDKDKEFFKELCEHHISGQLKVAPEHISDSVLRLMGKPGRNIYDRFVKEYQEINVEKGKKQYLVPYFMSSHPGSRLVDAIELAEYIRDTGQRPEQVQDFYPTPGTASTCMYYTELDPRTMRSVYVAKTPKEKAMQRALLQYWVKSNYNLVYEALTLTGREDLIGFGKKCLIPPRKTEERKGRGNRRVPPKR